MADSTVLSATVTFGSADALEVNPAQGAYIFDYYHDVDIIKTIVNCLSVLLLATAIVFWSIVCYNARYGHPYRCVTFLVVLVFSLANHILGMLTTLVWIPDSIPCHFVAALRAYFELGMYTFLFLYVLMCIGIAMRRLESGNKFFSLVVISLLLPLILVAATTSVQLILHPDTPCDLLDELSRHIWYDRVPKCFLLFGTICILAVLFYWLFCFDNTVFKLNRDYLLIRHSSVTVMILVNYCFFLELYQIVFLSHGPDGHVKSPAVARSGLILTVLMCAKGSFAAFLLCFLDLEIFNLVHNFPCCPDINNTVVDQAWEKRIRSESKVKFFEDSSDDNQTGKTNGEGKEKERVLPKTIHKYGTVTDEEEK